MIRLSHRVSHDERIHAGGLGGTIPHRRVPVCVIALLLILGSACGGSAATRTPTAPTATRTPLRLGPTSTPMPTPEATAPTPTVSTSPLPPVTEADWVRGPVDAAVTLVVYCDYQAPGCAQLAHILARLREWHPDELRIVHRLFPLIDYQDKSSIAAQAVLAAEAQGSLWEMHDALYSSYEDWAALDPAAFKVWLLELAQEIELDLESFGEALENERYRSQVTNAADEASAAGISTSPFVFLDGEWFRTPLEVVNLEMAVRLNLLSQQQFPAYPPITIDMKQDYFARLNLDIGEVFIRLYPLSAPVAVNNFVFLAQEGWYDGVGFYAVVPGLYAESGDPSETGLGGPGYFFPDEIDPLRRFDDAGMLAMAGPAPDTNGSRFLITLASIPEWNGSRTIFGKVVQGLDLLMDLEARQPFEDLLSPVPARIQSIEIEVR